MIKVCKKALKKILEKSNLGQKYLNKREAKKILFSPASLLYSNRNTDLVYDEAFNRVFMFVKSTPLKGDFLEFGVFAGYTARSLARMIKKFTIDDAKLHLFDSFIGLPEGDKKDVISYEAVNNIWKKGSMALLDGIEILIYKKLSKILSSERVCVVKGFFNDVLEQYIEQAPIRKARLIHFDCDLYSSTKYVLNILLSHEIIQDGSILIFDDWMCSLGNPNFGQRRAVKEILEHYPFWSFEQYFNYGIGSTVFVAHDARVVEGKMF
ncbi:MAG: class I SAM-dependent methyltransferase [Chlamydiae bacterium]|nr:class I SAM-dependent methyltransferase [Chlamydiota bacterium]